MNSSVMWGCCLEVVWLCILSLIGGGSVDYVMTLCSILLFPLSLRYAMATPGGVCVQPCERVFLRLMQILTRSFFFWLL